MALITRLLGRSGEIFLAGMARLNVNISPLTILLAEVLFLAIIGGAIVHFFNPLVGFYYDKDSAFLSYSSIIYASAAMTTLYYLFGLRKRIISHIKEECIIPPRPILLSVWGLTFALALFCFLWIFFQAGMKHPLFYVKSLNTLQVASLRSDIFKNINTNVHNLGLAFLMPLNLIISLFFIRRLTFTIISFILLIIFGTFALNKASLIYIFLFVLIFRMLISRLYLRKAFGYFVILICGIIFLFVYTKYSFLSFGSITRNIGGRILYGQMLELPYYYEIFANDRIGFKSLMPPYLVGYQRTAARIVAEYSIEKKFSRLPGHDKEEKKLYTRVSGDASTFFTGEAFAWGGYLGVIISPLIVMGNLVLFIYLFSKIKKTWVSVYVFSFLLYKVVIGVFGGISYFILSSAQIMFIIFVTFLVIARFLQREDIQWFNKVNKKLCIF